MISTICYLISERVNLSLVLICLNISLLSKKSINQERKRLNENWILKIKKNYFYLSSFEFLVLWIA